MGIETSMTRATSAVTEETPKTIQEAAKSMKAADQEVSEQVAKTGPNWADKIKSLFSKKGADETMQTLAKTDIASEPYDAQKAFRNLTFDKTEPPVDENDTQPITFGNFKEYNKNFRKETPNSVFENNTSETNPATSPKQTKTETSQTIQDPTGPKQEIRSAAEVNTDKTTKSTTAPDGIVTQIKERLADNPGEADILNKLAANRQKIEKLVISGKTDELTKQQITDLDKEHTELTSAYNKLRTPPDQQEKKPEEVKIKEPRKQEAEDKKSEQKDKNPETKTRTDVGESKDVLNQEEQLRYAKLLRNEFLTPDKNGRCSAEGGNFKEAFQNLLQRAGDPNQWRPEDMTRPEIIAATNCYRAFGRLEEEKNLTFEQAGALRQLHTEQQQINEKKIQEAADTHPSKDTLLEKRQQLEQVKQALENYQPVKYNTDPDGIINWATPEEMGPRLTRSIWELNKATLRMSDNARDSLQAPNKKVNEALQGKGDKESLLVLIAVILFAIAQAGMGIATKEMQQ